MFLRRLFYDLTTGAMLQMLTLSGAAVAQSLEADAEGLTNWGVLEWTEPDPATEAAFAEVDADGNPRRINVSVDVTGSEPQLVFEYEKIQAAKNPYEIIDIMEGINADTN